VPSPLPGCGAAADVLMSVASDHSKRNYAKALDEIFALCELRQQPFSRALLVEYRASPWLASHIYNLHC